jgi:hypothetical protein
MAIPGLHIISFDIPFPANYGGVIDVFYKISTLHRAGVKIHLHCYQYNREPANELEQYCESVHYYRRKTGLASHLGTRPYIVAGRMSEELIVNLLRDDLPILFEGLHTCGIMTDSRLQGRFMIYRESNIEHKYYLALAGAEKNPVKKLFFLLESVRLRMFQKILSHASVMLVVSKDDAAYLTAKFPGKRIVYLPSFHQDNAVKSLTGRGSYTLYQGKLSVPENSMAAGFIISKVWEDTFPELVIAGLDPPEWLSRLAATRTNVRLVPDPSDEAMFRLIREAHVNLLVTFQPTGLKLKLLNALYNGRFCLVNPDMVAGTSLETLCQVGKNPQDLKTKLRDLFLQDFSPDEITRRAQLLESVYSNQVNCNLFLEVIQPS